MSRPMWITILLLFVVAYAIICVGAYRVHRYFVYKPDPTYTAPQDTALENVEEVKLKTPDGVTLIAWWVPAREDMPTLLYFTGNGGSVAGRAKKIDEIARAGYGVFMLNYRGFGGSEGRPTEADNIADAERAYDLLMERGLKPKDVVIYGESLGTSVATQLSLKRPAKALVLEAPFTSAVSVGRLTWWFLPLRLVMVDKYKTISVIDRISMPLLIVHGKQDSVIPLRMAEELFAKAPDPKQMVVFPQADHNDLYEHGAFVTVDEYLQGLDKVQGSSRAPNAKKPASAEAAG
ncbi:2-hydroxy-6-oxononadienedioate/2-hydroxy-6-oxononatrienedioate hydrolase [Methyloligella halotolerans]|uniref:2-hydroxy-6-oxononadienedioate/2-hydroxy-6-oxononatrienedioate hydrolase n=1 Tax=Methyloligella halotolerans TaxID=1177755 RepID=A0A1E2RZ63_9HYPH|nr:alpha/beta hydrolase [Methyloligella halotolerans]ODA67527.1 2-hydroxy-6-oxononadienedioate/2-hydroxy-6-oxononatrienedioate hydrolase [Methyloligella halotolerans]